MNLARHSCDTVDIRTHRRLKKASRLAWRWLPTYSLRAHPMGWGCSAGHAPCTRHHTRQGGRDVVQDAEQHGEGNEPWQGDLSRRDQAPGINTAVELRATEDQTKIAV
jgi:hypothetical protein